MFSLSMIDEAQKATIERLEHRAATSDLKFLQMLQFQRSALAVGMFSLLEAHLQGDSDSPYPFRDLQRKLEMKGERELTKEFFDLNDAINVLKHGRGRSYYRLLKIEPHDLAFRLKRSGENFFDEGDVAEVSTLVEVNSGFVKYCASLISRISTKLG